MKKFLYVLIGCCLAVLVLGCAERFGKRNQDIPVQSVDTAMGTIVNQTVYAKDGAVISEEILNLITALEREVVSWRVDTAELYEINNWAGEEQKISNQMIEILQTCSEISYISSGAFDITVGSLARLWDIDTWAGQDNISEYHLPNDAEVLQCLEYTGYEKIVLTDGTINLPEQMQLDLGAVGKGIALDEIRAYLEQKEGITAAVISVGGSILTYGAKPDGKPWRVGIVNPLDSSGNLGYLELDGEWCVSTSGDYERYVEIDGIRYHHIINPQTGYPAKSGVKGVTILSKDGLLSDALSTACFILGEEKGRELAEHFGAEALFVDEGGNLVMTDGMERYFHLSKT